jgi:hypothetical protein
MRKKYLQAWGEEWYATSGLTYADLAMQVRIILYIHIFIYLGCGQVWSAHGDL